VESGSTNLYFVCVAFFGIERGNIQYIGCVFRFFPSLKKKMKYSSLAAKERQRKVRGVGPLFLFSSFLVGLFVCLVSQLPFLASFFDSFL